MATEPIISRHEQTLNRHGKASSRRDPSLRPARWPGPPRAVTVVRAAVIAALLVVAAGVLYSQETAACPRPQSAADAIATPTSVPAQDRPLPIPRGLVGVPVRLVESAALAVVRPGGRVDLLAFPTPADGPASDQPGVVAPSALVLDVLTGDSDAPSAILLALDPEQARRTVALPDTTRFAVILR